MAVFTPQELRRWAQVRRESLFGRERVCSVVLSVAGGCSWDSAFDCFGSDVC